jgi:hypothetical protein
MLSVDSSASSPTGGNDANGPPRGAASSFGASSEPDGTDPALRATPRGSADPASGFAAASVEVEVESGEARRGGRIHVRGRVTADGDACPAARVDFTLEAPQSRAFTLGSLPTDPKGQFDAELTVPLGLDVGDYSLSATTPGSGACGASH